MRCWTRPCAGLEARSERPARRPRPHAGAGGSRQRHRHGPVACAAGDDRHTWRTQRCPRRRRFSPATRVRLAASMPSASTARGGRWDASSCPRRASAARSRCSRLRPTACVIRITLPGLGDMLRGYDGAIGWSVDPAVGPRVLSGRELQEAEYSADFYADIYRPADYASMTVVGRGAVRGTRLLHREAGSALRLRVARVLRRRRAGCSSAGA